MTRCIGRVWRSAYGSRIPFDTMSVRKTLAHRGWARDELRTLPVTGFLETAFRPRVPASAICPKSSPSFHVQVLLSRGFAEDSGSCYLQAFVVPSRTFS